jgi:hypothetical protein
LHQQFIHHQYLNIMNEHEKKYLVKFTDKRTGAFVKEVVIRLDERSVEKNSAIVVLKAIDVLKESGQGIPQRSAVNWSFEEF